MTPKQRFKTVTTINGIRVPNSKAKISIFDNALLYAEGLFETFLAIDDRIIFARDHLDRLWNGAAAIKLKIPVSRKMLGQWMAETAAAHPDRIKKLRLTLTSGEAARWTGRAGKPQILLSASPHSLPEKPFRLVVADWRVDHQSSIRQIKSLSNVIHAAALKEARHLGFDDALLLNQDSNIAEVTSANIFWVRKDRLYTPPLKAGCLEGTTRKHIIKQADKLGFKTIQRHEGLSGMLKADEIFISSSLKLVIPVGLVAASGKSYRFEAGKVTALLSEKIRRLVFR